MSTRITFNGREYSSPDEMPPDVRKAYEAIEGLMKAAQSGALGATRENVRQDFRVEVSTSPDGSSEVRRYSSLEEMPSEVRRMFEEATHAAQSGAPAPPGFSFDVRKSFDVKLDGPKVLDVRRTELPSGPRGAFEPAGPRGPGGASSERLLILALAVLAGLALVLALAWLMIKA